MDLTLRLFNPSNEFPDLNQSIIESSDAGVGYEQLQCHNSTSNLRHPHDAIDLNSFPDHIDDPTSHIVSSASIGLSKTSNGVTEMFCSSSREVWDFSKGVCRSLPVRSKKSGINEVFSEQSLKHRGEKVENNEVGIKNARFKTGDEKKMGVDCVESSEEFDDVIYTLDGHEEKELADYMASLRVSVGKSTVQEEEGPSGAKEEISYNVNKKKKKKKKNKKKKTNMEQPIDLNALLISCAEFVAEGDLPKAKEMLREIRQHSSPCGNGGQRLAHYFADGLEARLAGPNSDMFKSLGPSDYLKAHCMSVVFSPYRRIHNFVFNNMISMRSRKTTGVHIIDFGICYNFHWPSFIQHVAKQAGSPPALRITGVDFPLPGPRPTERVEEMGRRLASFAKAYGVPFEYKPIARAWGDINLEDLDIQMNEFLVVNLSRKAQNLPDEMNAADDKSRSTVLNLIRETNPDIFVQRVIHSAHGSLFFIPRFREALLYYSVMFDLLENDWPGDVPERMVVERDVYGKEVLNVVACEGWERVERPETYKQWHGRVVRAGFTQIPLGRSLMAALMHKVRKCYHRELHMFEENGWLLLSWKGRTLYGMSFWQSTL